jgi:hypothetical protein
MHGGPFTEAIVSRVHRFSHQLSAWAVVESLEAVLEGNTIYSHHQTISQKTATWRRDLGRKDPLNMIFTP